MINTAAVLVCASGMCQGQDRVATHWNSAASGMFDDASRWSDGYPNNRIGDTIWDATINSIGQPYTVSLNAISGGVGFEVQTLTLDSSDATLSLTNNQLGLLMVREHASLLAGTLILRNSGIFGAPERTRVDLGPEMNFEIYRNGSSSHFASMRNLDFYGGDLVIEGGTNLDFGNSSVREGALVMRTLTGFSNITVSETVDYDIHFDNTTDRRNELITHVDGLEISAGATISGRNFWVQAEGGGFPDWLPASFINHGTIRLDGGEARINMPGNSGIVHANGGLVRFRGDNDGTLLATVGAELYAEVTNNGADQFHHNTGLIEARGEGAVFRIDGSFPIQKDGNEDFWSSTGTVRIVESATGQFGSVNLQELGTIERDASARIEISGRLNLDGGTLDQNTFHGLTYLADPEPLISGNSEGEIVNGIIDVSGNWLRYFGFYIGIGNSEIIGGDLLIDPSSYGGTFTRVLLGDITIRDGDLVLGTNGNVIFQEIIYDDGIVNFNGTINTITTGTQLNVGVGSSRLNLGVEARIEGKIKLGVWGGASVLVYNEGTILSDVLTGRVDTVCSVENHGLVGIRLSAMTSVGTFRNEGFVRIDFSAFDGQTFENNSTLEIARASSITLSRDLVLEAGSDISVDALSFQQSITVNQTMTLGGALHVDLSRIVEPGTYQLYSAQTVLGEFDSVSISALSDDLVFKGLETSGAYTISLKCHADFSGDGVLDFFDISEFLNLYSVGDPSTDFNQDGQWDFFDISAFLTLFSAGCP